MVSEPIPSCGRAHQILNSTPVSVVRLRFELPVLRYVFSDTDGRCHMLSMKIESCESIPERPLFNIAGLISLRRSPSPTSLTALGARGSVGSTAQRSVSRMRMRMHVQRSRGQL